LAGLARSEVRVVGIDVEGEKKTNGTRIVKSVIRVRHDVVRKKGIKQWSTSKRAKEPFQVNP
jgi:hypothetical protein